jgi:hypothetical protein
MLRNVANLHSTFFAQKKIDGFYYVSKHGYGWGRSHQHHPENDNIVSSTSTMDKEETRRIIKRCAIVIP